MNAAAEEQSVLAIEDAYVRAEVSRDEVELRRLVDDRFVFNRSNGTTWGKEELIAGVLGMHMTGQTVRERRVLIEGDVALVFGTADLRTADAAGQESETALRYTATYVRREGSWRMLALQMQQRAKD
jgi:ketosteroid isomerase-like protein